jgi:hypothetical protein
MQFSILLFSPNYALRLQDAIKLGRILRSDPLHPLDERVTRMRVLDGCSLGGCEGFDGLPVLNGKKSAGMGECSFAVKFGSMQSFLKERDCQV